MRTTAVTAISFCASVSMLAACAGGDDGGGGDAGPDIVVTAEQEELMCDILTADVDTGPLPILAGADMESAPGLSAQPGKRPVTLTDYQGQNGGYLRLTLDPVNNTPVILMFDDPMPFEVVLEDGEVVDFHEAQQGSDLCDAAAGRYTWWVSDSTNYLKFGPTEQLNFDLVIETVD